MAAVSKSKEADTARCRRHPRHRQFAGVCPFCLRERLSSASMAAGANASASPSSSASSPCSSGEESVALGQVPAALPRGEEGEAWPADAAGGEGDDQMTADLGAGRRGHEAASEEKKKPTKTSNFWARLQQLHHGSWHRKDGCSPWPYLRN